MCCLFWQDRSSGALSGVRSCDGCQISCVLCLVLWWSVTKDHNTVRNTYERCVSLMEYMMGVVCFSVLRGSIGWLVMSHVVRLSAQTTDALLERGAERHVTEAMLEKSNRLRLLCLSRTWFSVYITSWMTLSTRSYSYDTELFSSSHSLLVSMATLNDKMNPWAVLLLTLIHHIRSWIYSLAKYENKNAVVMVTLILKWQMKRKYL